MNRKVILGHPFGNANVRQALRALVDADLLDVFVTTICAERLPLVSLLPTALKSEVCRRSFEGVPPERIVTHPYHEFLRLGAKRFERSFPFLHRIAPDVDKIWHRLDVDLRMTCTRRSPEQSIVYAYEDGAFSSFSLLSHAYKVYELPIGYWKSMHALLGQERELNPEWAPTLRGLSDPNCKLERKDAELALADRIIVPSEFVRSTLPDQWLNKTSMVRYGCADIAVLDNNLKKRDQQRPLKVLFCGSLGQRKGISYLFEAIRRLGHHVTLTVIGSPTATCPILDRALVGTNWYKSVSRSKVLEIMRDHDVFLFPTLFEGRALVVLEALSQGLPVITTRNSGTEDAVIDGVSGFIVPIQSVDAIVEALETLCSDRQLVHQMGEEAIKIAAKITWEKYRADLISVLTTSDIGG